MDTKSVVTRLVADNKQFDSAMKGSIVVMERFNKAGEMIGSSVKVTTKTMGDAADKTDGFRLAMTKLSRDIKVAGTILDTVATSLREVYQAASEGAKITAAEQFFVNAGKSIEGYREATKGMVDDAELMKKANLADSMGIDEKTFKKLVMVAEASALKTGQSFDYMFNSIIVGTARSSRLLLDNLGIIVSVKQANEKYAESIGKTVEELSAEEKQIAFVNEVALKSQGTLDEYARATDKTAESFARFEAAIENVATAIKTTLASAIGGSGILDAFTKMFNDILEVVKGGKWADIGSYIGLKIAQGVMSGLDYLNPAYLFGKLGAKIAGVEMPKTGNDFTAAALGSQADNVLTGVRESVSGDKAAKTQVATILQAGLVKELGGQWKDAVQNFVDLGSTGMGEVTDTLVKSFEAANRAAENLFGVFKKKTAVDAAGKTGKGGKAGGGNKDTIADAEIAMISYNAAASAAEKELAFIKDGMSLMPPILGDLKNTLAESGVEFKRLNNRIKEINRLNSEKISASVADTTTQIASGQGLFKPIADSMLSLSGGVASAVSTGVASVFEGISVGGAVLKGTAVGGAAGPIGAAVGALAAVLLSLIDKIKPVIDILSAVMDGLELLLKNGLEQFLFGLTLLADPIEHLLAAIGVLVGSALRPLVNILTLVAGVVAVVIEAISFVVVVLSPFVEMIMWFITTFVTSGLGIISLFFDVEAATYTLMSVFNTAGDAILGFVIQINNAIVRFAKKLGLKGFGKILKREDFQKDPIEENTSAVNANTAAVRDLTREFRNLPGSYKAEGAIYSAQDAERRRFGGRTGVGLLSPITNEGLTHQRWRT